MSILKGRSVKAVRKAHVCDWCGEPIEAGQPTDYSAGFNDEEQVFWSSYMHPECAAAWHEFHAREDIESDWWDFRGMKRGSSSTVEELMDELRAVRAKGEGEAEHAT